MLHEKNKSKNIKPYISKLLSSTPFEKLLLPIEFYVYLQ